MYCFEGTPLHYSSFGELLIRLNRGIDKPGSINLELMRLQKGFRAIALLWRQTHEREVPR